MRVRSRLLQHYKKKRPRDRAHINKIYVAGVRPAAGFGSMVLGASDQKLASLRSVLMSGKSPAHRGASATAKCVFHGDPARRQAVAPSIITVVQQPLAEPRGAQGQSSLVPGAHSDLACHIEFVS
eukprot:9480520-Pyramimonas_sp.AAC.2